MSTCISDEGEFSSHVMIREDENNYFHCERCSYVDYGETEANDAPAVIMQQDWTNLCVQVAEIHAVMKELGQQVGPLIGDIQTRGIMGVLMGSKKKG